MSFEFHVLPVLEDNYIHILLNTELKSALIVDPPEPEALIDFLEARQIDLKGILITHHHHDHIDGVPALKAVYNCPVYAPKKNKDVIYFADHFVSGGDHLSLAGFDFEIWDLPGHTEGHIGFWEPGLKWFYCGDTLFSMGCGRIFDGSIETLFASLRRLTSLPTNSLLFCTHEYTQRNLNFCKAQFPEKDYGMVEKWIQNRRNKGLPTIPTTIEREIAYNPFLIADNLTEFRRLRELRDTY